MITNPKPKVDNEQFDAQERQDWDFDKGFSQNLFDERGEVSPEVHSKHSPD